MPPKKKDAPSKKTEQKQKAKVIEVLLVTTTIVNATAIALLAYLFIVYL